MNSNNSRPVLDRIVSAALGLLVAAVAVYAAVKLLVAIWSTLLLILGAGLLVAVLVAAWRSRRRGW